MNIFHSLFCIFGCIFYICLSSAHALMISMESTGGGTFSCADGAVCDQSPATGVVSAVTNLGGTVVSFNTTGTGNPAFGSASLPGLDLSTVVTTDGTTDVVFRVGVTQTNFGPLTGTRVFDVALGGTTRGTVDVNAYGDGTNVLFGTGTLISHLGPYDGPAFSEVDTGDFTGSGPYSLTIFADIHHQSGAQRITSFDAELSSLTAIPEPATLSLFGVGLILLAGWRKKLAA